MDKALKDIVVLDMTHVLAGPYCTMVLADLGARVIKIEPPWGDDSREFGPFITPPDKQDLESAYYISINRNKESLCLDLKSDEGKKIIWDLIKKADIIVENFRPTAMKRLGFSYEAMREVNPGIIYCSICGYGHDALPEYAEKPAYDLIAQALSGLMSITGPEGGEPVRVGSSVGDIVSGLQAAIGILSALHYREKTGKGQYVDIAMVDSLVAIMENAIVRYTVSGQIPGPLGNAHPSITPFQSFITRDGGHLILPIGNDNLWVALCKTLNRLDLLEKDCFKTNSLRTENKSKLLPLLQEEFLKKDLLEWQKILKKADIPHSQINTMDKVVKDPNLIYRKMITEIEQPNGIKITSAGSPYKLSETPGRIYAGAPKVGEHTKEILKELLQYPDEKIETLLEHGQVMQYDGRSS